ncbi:MAG: cell division protein FtsZ, partial [Bdellovibrionales bacterium]
IVIPNQNLFRVANEKTTFADAFQMADGVLQAGVKGVTDLIVRPGLVNLDFADIRTGMLEMGKAMMGTGEAEGEKRAIEAAEAAINNPLLDDVSMKGAHGVIINVTGGYDMTLFEADEACNRIRDEVDPDANIIFGATFDQNLDGKMRVSIVATGIEKESIAKTGGANGNGSGGFKADTRGGTVLERATPKTQSESQATAATTAGVPTQTSFIPAQNIPGDHVHAIKAPTPVNAPLSVQAAPDVAPKRETEIDMFEQSEFVSSLQEGKDDMPQNTALRGTRYKNAFIPPKPVEGNAPAHISSFHGAHITAKEQEETGTTSGIVAPSRLASTAQKTATKKS